jgi:hypothetical protein
VASVLSRGAAVVRKSRAPSRLLALARSPEAFVAGMAVYVAVLLAVDMRVDLTGQLLLGVVTWALFAAALVSRSHGERAAAIGVVAVATAGECFASLLLGLYTYRLGNIPLFVPPGHGLLYLSALTASRTWLVRRFPVGYVLLAAVTGSVWSVIGLTVLPQQDLLGALAMLALLFFFWIGNSPQTYAAAFFAVAYLELYGTTVGNWRWHPHTLGLDFFPAGNPPAGAAAGYVLFELGAFVVGPWFYYKARAAAGTLRA